MKTSVEPLYGQNFEKDRDYVPPVSMKSQLGVASTPVQPQMSLERLEASQVTPEDQSQVSSEMPFDCVGSVNNFPPEPSSLPISQELPLSQKTEYSPTPTRGINSAYADDEDSLFHFEHIPRQFLQTDHNPENIVSDTSLDFSYGFRPNPVSPTNLQERSHQAWKSRRQKTSSLRNDQNPKKKKPANVSFGASDTVHHFQTDIEDDEDTYPDLDERSLNSEYTKSLESEVEDMIKDMLFIGNPISTQPGRRKFKHKNEEKRRLRESHLQGLLDGANSTKSEEESFGLSKYTCSSRSENGTGCSTSFNGSIWPSTDDEDPLNLVWGMVSEGVVAVKGALQNFDTENSTNTTTDTKSSNRGLRIAECQNFDTENSTHTTTDTKSSNRGLRIAECASGDPRTALSAYTDLVPVLIGDCTGKVPRVEECKQSMNEMTQYTQDYFHKTIGDSNVCSRYMDSKSCADEKSEDANTDQDGELMFSSADDQRLAQLAIHAARSLHQTRCVRYDDSIAIDLDKDVKLSVVKLNMPLGCKF